MYTLFHRFGRKNEKLLRRELALAHTCIIFLSIGLIALLAAGYDRLGANHALVIAACALLLFVIVISVSVVAYIVKTRK